MRHSFRIVMFAVLGVSCIAVGQEKARFYAMPWKMHHIDQKFINHNSLSPADINKDGFDDYLVIHETGGWVTVLFHPGVNNRLYHAWEKVPIAKGRNVEYGYFGDLDGDGNFDVVYANGNQSSIHVIWGPEASDANDPEKWEDGGVIPASEDQGHYLFLETFDINGDGALDIVAGGRLHRSGKLNGLLWLKAPEDKPDRRDLSKWQMHSIDEKLTSGHGFVIADINGDGREDIVIANPDWDTTYTDNKVMWYENPGKAKVTKPWQSHVVLKETSLFAKPQVAVGDLNGDGKIDLAVQSDNFLYYLEQGKDAYTWKRYVIAKPEITRWVTRPTKMADLNGDGKMDIVGMTIHNFGNTPVGKAAVFCMEYTGDKPGEDNWQTKVIKWSDGYFSGKTYMGEKWDHMRFVDLDRDGDLDIIANCEEYYGKVNSKRQTYLGVVWFENPKINP